MDSVGDYLKKFSKKNMELEDYESELKKFTELENEIENIEKVKDIGAMSLKMNDLVVALKALCKEKLHFRGSAPQGPRKADWARRRNQEFLDKTEQRSQGNRLPRNGHEHSRGNPARTIRIRLEIRARLGNVRSFGDLRPRRHHRLRGDGQSAVIAEEMGRFDPIGRCEAKGVAAATREESEDVEGKYSDAGGQCQEASAEL